MRRLLTLTPLALLVAAVGGFFWSLWRQFQPESSGRFEMTGEFVRADYSGTLWVGRGEEFNTWSYMLILTEDEYNRADTTYTEWQRKTGPGTVEDRPGFVYYGRESTGNWCGNLPQAGTMVSVESPTGYTRDVVIRDEETGREFRSRGDCKRSIFTYHVRVSLRNTGEVILETTAKGPDSFEAATPFQGYMTDEQYVFQIWQEGENPPPPYQP